MTNYIQTNLPCLELSRRDSSIRRAVDNIIFFIADDLWRYRLAVYISANTPNNRVNARILYISVKIVTLEDTVFFHF